MMEEVRRLKAEGRFTEVNGLVPYTAFVDLHSVVQEDELLTVLRSKPSNMGNTIIRAVHGGVVGALLEHTAAMQLMWERDLQSPPKIINISIDFLRPCLCDLDTWARGEVVKQGRRVSNVRVRAWQEDRDKPVAAAHAHFLLE